MLHIESAKVVGPYQLNVQFSTGETRRVNLRPLLKGPVFRPLRDMGFFNLVRVNPECRTVVWPNGADLAPEALYDLPDMDVPGEAARAREVRVSKDALTVELSDKRVVSVPLQWYPRLAHGTPRERNHWELIGKGHGIHWPELDEDISVEDILCGQPSGESRRSFRRWLEARPSKVVRGRTRKLAKSA